LFVTCVAANKYSYMLNVAQTDSYKPPAAAKGSTSYDSKCIPNKSIGGMEARSSLHDTSLRTPRIHVTSQPKEGVARLQISGPFSARGRPQTARNRTPRVSKLDLSEIGNLAKPAQRPFSVSNFINVLPQILRCAYADLVQNYDLRLALLHRVRHLSSKQGNSEENYFERTHFGPLIKHR
jgi:hypothetical protein